MLESNLQDALLDSIPFVSLVDMCFRTCIRGGALPDFGMVISGHLLEHYQGSAQS
jgi:hypothetical protein